MIFVPKWTQVIITITVISTELKNPASTCHQDRLVDIKTSCGAFSTPLFCMRNATYVCLVLLLSFYGPQETRQNFTICQIRYYRKPYNLYSIRLRNISLTVMVKLLSWIMPRLSPRDIIRVIVVVNIIFLLFGGMISN